MCMRNTCKCKASGQLCNTRCHRGHQCKNAGEPKWLNQCSKLFWASKIVVFSVYLCIFKIRRNAKLSIFENRQDAIVDFRKSTDNLSIFENRQIICRFSKIDNCTVDFRKSMSIFENRCRFSKIDNFHISTWHVHKHVSRPTSNTCMNWYSRASVPERCKKQLIYAPTVDRAFWQP